MDEKKFALFSKALLILCEGHVEDHGGTLVNPRVVLVGPDSTADEESATENRKS